MHVGKYFKNLHIFKWTFQDSILFFIIAFVPTFIYEILGFKNITIPWLPVALIGTAVAFIIGFKNNASYDRLWEARKIWGGIVNGSRAWGIMTRDFIRIKNDESPAEKDVLYQTHKRLIYRHIAWISALRYQLRQPRYWENIDLTKSQKKQNLKILPEQKTSLEDEIDKLLSPEEKSYVLNKQNPATQIINLQSKELKELFDQGLLDNFGHISLNNRLVDLYNQQGQCERIKNFPYPRQYATINRIFIWLFILLVPFGMLEEFEDLGGMFFIWLTIPFSMLVAWVFHSMEKVGEASENPFQGGVNDIPMAALNRSIEIDLRDMLDEENIPAPLQPVDDILM